jgi:Uma2 family endonuclease
MRAAERRTKKPRRPKKAKSQMAIQIGTRFEIPKWVRDHSSFRRWARSPVCPEKLRLAYFQGTLWVDPDMEQFFVHNQVKLAIALVLAPLVRANKTGRYGTDGMLVTNPNVELSTVPDGFFYSFDAFRSGRIRERAGPKNGCTEFEGVPEMVLEVVSNSSETKDLVHLREWYWKGGIEEYWLVDARTEEVSFEILKRGDSGYVSEKRSAGSWIRSDVFRNSFRLVRGEDEVGKPVYTLEVK